MSPTARTEESVAEIARQYFESVGSRDTNVMMDFWQPGGKAYIHGMTTLTAPEGYHEWFGAIFRAIPDIEFEILDIVAEDEKAAVRWRASGTFNGEGQWEGLSPTGAEIMLEGFDLLTIRDGLVQENRAYVNESEIARQIGAMPPSGSAGEKAMKAGVNARTAITGKLRELRNR